MKTVPVWVINDRLSDGMPGENKYFLSEEKADSYFKDNIWQEKTKISAFSVNGTVYFHPREIPVET